MCSRKDFRPILLFCIFFGFFTFSAFSASALPIKPDPGDGSGGAQTPGQPPANVAATPGTPRSWEGHVGAGSNNVKTGNGNKQTSIPIVGWQVRVSKSQIRYHFSGNGLYFYLTSISDESGNTITINRANGLQVSSIVDPTGRSLTINKDSSGRATSVTDFTGRQWTFQYDATNTNGNLTQINYPSVSGQSYNVQFGYDGSHNITRFQDKRGNALTFGYNTADGSNSLAWGQDSYGSRTTYTYGTSSTTITDPNGHSVVHTL